VVYAYLNHYMSFIYSRNMNKSEFEQNEKLQKVVDQFKIKLNEKDETIVKVSCVIIITYLVYI